MMDIITAIKNLDFNFVKDILNRQPPKSEGSSSALLPLHAAAEIGCVEMLKLLMKHGLDVNQADSDGRTPFEIAVYYGHFDAAKFLVENGANVNKNDINIFTSSVNFVESQYHKFKSLFTRQQQTGKTNSNLESSNMQTEQNNSSITAPDNVLFICNKNAPECDISNQLIHPVAATEQLNDTPDSPRTDVNSDDNTEGKQTQQNENKVASEITSPRSTINSPEVLTRTTEIMHNRTSGLTENDGGNYTASQTSNESEIQVNTTAENPVLPPNKERRSSILKLPNSKSPSKEAKNVKISDEVENLGENDVELELKRKEALLLDAEQKKSILNRRIKVTQRKHSIGRKLK